MNDVKFTFFDMAGEGRYRTLWEKYYDLADGIIVVIDASDWRRLSVLKNEID